MEKSGLAIFLTFLILACSGLFGGILYFVLREKPTCPKPQIIEKLTTCESDATGNKETSQERQCLEIITKVESEDLCLTEECTITASTFVSAMDTSLDPCEDFYEFSCSKFIKKHLVAEEDISFNTWEIFNTYFDLQMKEIIEKLDPYNEPKVVARVQEAYHVCINTSYQEEVELAAFRNFTVETLRWPLATGKDWPYAGESVNDYIMQMESTTLDNPYFSFHVEPIENDTTQFEIMIFTKTFDPIHDDETISEEDKKEKKLLIEMMEDLAEILGNEDRESIQKDFQNMKIVSEKYVQLSKEEITKDIYIGDNEDDNEETENNEDYVEPYLMNMPIQKLNDLCYNKINWLDILNKKLEKFGSHKLSKTDNVTVFRLKQTRILCRLIDIYPIRVMVNLLAAHNVFEVGKYAGPLVEPIYRKLEALRDIELLPKKRWMGCLKHLQFIYPLVLTRIFVNEYINKCTNRFRGF